MQILKRLWQDELGFLTSTDLLIVCTVVVLGMMVGLVTYRDQVVQELGDMAGAVGAINQTYSIDAYTISFSFSSMAVGTFVSAGSSFDDMSDFCDEGDNAGDPPECIEFTAPSEEGP